MAGPPKDIPADELFAKLLERPRPSEVVDWVRKDADGKPLGKIRIQVLTMEDHNRARLRAREYVAKQGVDTKEIANDDALQQIMGDATALELLALACVHPDRIQGSTEENPGYALVFTGGADQLRENLTADELTTLFNYYLLIQEKYGPNERTIETDEELTDWIDRLVEGASALPLARLNSYQRVELITSLAARCYSLSAILAYLRPSLPESSRSVLETLGIGPGSATEQASNTIESGSSPSETVDPEQAAAVDVAIQEMAESGEAITMEKAIDLAKRLSVYK